MSHECVELFQTTKIDECSGEGYNICSGLSPMILSVWYQDQDGTECYCDNWIEINVKYCPYCGIKADDYQSINEI